MLELAWIDTHICVADDGNTIKAFIFAGCLMTRTQRHSFPFYITNFYAPDGRRFLTEKELIKYMDNNYDNVRTGE